jgi:hypothetical protein
MCTYCNNAKIGNFIISYICTCCWAFVRGNKNCFALHVKLIAINEITVFQMKEKITLTNVHDMSYNFS